ncbi:MAG TPA: molybdate ABC transporter substrate-binding protein [Galbitalea sp.]|nr:molybdate ABC transporter substrate-binding protein [Galbitalea sp.]
MKKYLGVGAILAAAAVLLAGCSTTAPGKAATPLSGTIVVDAASSLTGTFDKVAAAFDKLHPGSKVTFNYGGSGDLAAAIVAGAPVDVFAAASPATESTVVTAGLVHGTPKTFVKNQLEIVVPAGNPGKITGLADFAIASKKIALCETAQPCGAASAAVFADAKIVPKPDTLEPDVKGVLTAVQLDQVDAGLVYRTDVISGGSAVEGIPFANSSKFIVGYPIGVLKSSGHLKLAEAFAAYVLSAPAQKILTGAGFIAK